MAMAPAYARGLQRCVATFGYFNETDLAAEALQKLHHLAPTFTQSYVRETYPYEHQQHLDKLLQGFRQAGAFSD